MVLPEINEPHTHKQTKKKRSSGNTSKTIGTHSLKSKHVLEYKVHVRKSNPKEEFRITTEQDRGREQNRPKVKGKQEEKL